MKLNPAQDKLLRLLCRSNTDGHIPMVISGHQGNAGAWRWVDVFMNPVTRQANELMKKGLAETRGVQAGLFRLYATDDGRALLNEIDAKEKRNAKND